MSNMTFSEARTRVREVTLNYLNELNRNFWSAITYCPSDHVVARIYLVQLAENIALSDEFYECLYRKYIRESEQAHLLPHDPYKKYLSFIAIMRNPAFQSQSTDGLSDLEIQAKKILVEGMCSVYTQAHNRYSHEIYYDPTLISEKLNAVTELIQILSIGTNDEGTLHDYKIRLRESNIACRQNPDWDAFYNIVSAIIFPIALCRMIMNSNVKFWQTRGAKMQEEANAVIDSAIVSAIAPEDFLPKL